MSTQCLEYLDIILLGIPEYFTLLSKYIAMESNNLDEIGVLDSIMFEVGCMMISYYFIVCDIIYPRPDRGTCTSPGIVSTPQCCQSRRRRPGPGRGQRTAGPADSATPAVTRAAAASGPTSSSSSSSSAASLVRQTVSDKFEKI